MLVSDFDFDLPEDLIAQAPAPERGTSRLLVLGRATGAIQHASIADLTRFLRPGDLLVVNNTRVFPARLLGHRVPSGGAVECLLIARSDETDWEALVHPGQKLRPGARFRCDGAGGSLLGEIVSQHTFGRRRIRLTLERGESIDQVIDSIGHVPLPPYIKRPDEATDREQYQTVFASVRGSVAAPTAGLHFSDEMMAAIADRGVERTEITLHVGYGTFKPVRVEQVQEHIVDAEEFDISPTAAKALSRALSDGRRIVAVGTTTTRALESAARENPGAIAPGRRSTSLFIYPGFDFRVVKALLTNFHVPRSSLLMLVCAFARREHVLAAYHEAVAQRYRFYSYGDAMFIG